MASDPYSITINNSTVLIPEETLDTSTSLELPGRYYSEWGAKYAQNYASLLENFRSYAGGPSDPVPGQLWFDASGTGVLKLRNKGNTAWGDVATPPTLTVTGDVTGTGSLANPVALTLSNTGVTPGFYNSPAITVDAKGRITSVDNTGGDGGGPAQYVSSFNTRGGNVVLNSGDVTAALGFTPYNSSNPAGYTGPTDISGKLSKTGDVMLGTLNMNGNRITALPAPADGAEPARLVDLTNVANNRTQRVFNGAGTITYNVTVSPNAPSGGNEGDVWYRY